jgi:hypothetical protein
MIILVLRSAAIGGAPIGLGLLAAVHPIVDGTLVPQDRLWIWTLIHTLQIPLAALLGVALMLLLEEVDGPEARVARFAIVPWVAAFAAFDGVAGLATGALSGYGHDNPDHAAIVLGVGQTLAASPIIAAVLPLMALTFALLAFGGGAIALHRVGLAAPAAVALASGGIAWTFIHPLVGAPAMALFLAGAIAAERSRARARRRSSQPLAMPA